MNKPNEIIPIDAESLRIVEIYLENDSSIEDTARILGINGVQVTQYLQKREVKSYIDQLYLSAGYRNRNKIASVMDSIIEKKLADMSESEMGSSKDILDLLTAAHKFRMEEIKAMTEHEKVLAGSVKNQTNVQINESPYGSGNYGKLLEKIFE